MLHLLRCVVAFTLTVIQLNASGHRDAFVRNGYGEIQLRRSGEHRLYISGKLNGRRCSYLVDTGWSFTTVATNVTRVAGSRLPVEISLGDFSFTNQFALVEDIRFNGQRAPFDAVLGLDFLRANFAALDCARRRIYLRQNAPTDEEKNQLSDALELAGLTAIDLRLRNPPAITAVTFVNKLSLEMLVDSGARWSCLDWRECDRLGLKALPSAARISGTGKTGSCNVAIAEAKSFQIGELNLARQTFAVFDLSEWGFAAPDKPLSEVGGILGAEFLMANDAIIDLHALKLWVKTLSR